MPGFCSPSPSSRAHSMNRTRFQICANMYFRPTICASSRPDLRPAFAAVGFDQLNRTTAAHCKTLLQCEKGGMSHMTRPRRMPG
jgi:hypothetical protein